MRRYSGFLLTRILIPAALSAAGCASTASTVAHIEAPPPLAGFFARYENGGLCQADRAYEVAPTSDADAAAVTSRLCSPVFPKELIARGYEADCVVRFRIDAAGAADAPAGSCEIVHGGGDGEWDAFALAAFTRLAEMSAAQSSYDTECMDKPSNIYLRRYSFRLR